ncbi:MAG: spike base protein, RCAP_Rcc01079 family [Sphingobium sp.]
MPYDPYQYPAYNDSVATPARAPYTVVPHDTNALPVIPKGIFVGTGGQVTLRGVDASLDVVYKNLPDGSYINVRAAYIRATGTTATDLIAEV